MRATALLRALLAGALNSLGAYEFPSDVYDAKSVGTDYCNAQGRTINVYACRAHAADAGATITEYTAADGNSLIPKGCTYTQSANDGLLGYTYNEPVAPSSGFCQSDDYVGTGFWFVCLCEPLVHTTEALCDSGPFQRLHHAGTLGGVGGGTRPVQWVDLQLGWADPGDQPYLDMVPAGDDYSSLRYMMATVPSSNDQTYYNLKGSVDRRFWLLAEGRSQVQDKIRTGEKAALYLTYDPTAADPLDAVTLQEMQWDFTMVPLGVSTNQRFYFREVCTTATCTTKYTQLETHDGHCIAPHAGSSGYAGWTASDRKRLVAVDCLTYDINQKYGVECFPHPPPTPPAAPPPPLVPLEGFSGSEIDGVPATVCSEAEDFNDPARMHTYNECKQIFQARAYEGGQYWLGWTRNGTALVEADLTEDEKANTIGLCTLYRFELGSPESSFFRSPGDMNFFPWYNNTGLLDMFRCVEFWPCYCKPKAVPAAPPPALPLPPVMPGSCAPLMAKTIGRTPVTEVGAGNKNFCFQIGNVENCNNAYRWKDDSHRAVQVCYHDGSACTFTEYDEGALCNYPPRSPPPPLPPRAPFWSGCTELQAIIDARTEVTDNTPPKTGCQQFGNPNKCVTLYKWISSSEIKKCEVVDGSCKGVSVTCPSPPPLLPPSPPPPSPPGYALVDPMPVGVTCADRGLDSIHTVGDCLALAPRLSPAAVAGPTTWPGSATDFPYGCLLAIASSGSRTVLWNPRDDSVATADDGSQSSSYQLLCWGHDPPSPPPPSPPPSPPPPLPPPPPASPPSPFCYYIDTTPSCGFVDPKYEKPGHAITNCPEGMRVETRDECNDAAEQLINNYWKGVGSKDAANGLYLHKTAYNYDPPGNPDWDNSGWMAGCHMRETQRTNGDQTPKYVYWSQRDSVPQSLFDECREICKAYCSPSAPPPDRPPPLAPPPSPSPPESPSPAPPPPLEPPPSPPPSPAVPYPPFMPTIDPTPGDAIAWPVGVTGPHLCPGNACGNCADRGEDIIGDSSLCIDIANAAGLITTSNVVGLGHTTPYGKNIQWSGGSATRTDHPAGCSVYYVGNPSPGVGFMKHYNDAGAGQVQTYAESTFWIDDGKEMMYYCQVFDSPSPPPPQFPPFQPGMNVKDTYPGGCFQAERIVGRVNINSLPNNVNNCDDLRTESKAPWFDISMCSQFFKKTNKKAFVLCEPGVGNPPRCLGYETVRCSPPPFDPALAAAAGAAAEPAAEPASEPAAALAAAADAAAALAAAAGAEPAAAARARRPVVLRRRHDAALRRRRAQQLPGGV